MIPDRLIISTDKNPMYFDFWNIVATSWRKFFPEIKTTLAFVSDIGETSEMLIRMSEKMEVRVFKPITGVYDGNYAKIARYLLASEFPGEVCCCYDIDSIPLQKRYFEKLMENKIPGKMMAVGAEVYANTPHEGKFPAGFFTAEGSLFQDLFNPERKDNVSLLEEWRDILVFDKKESPFNSPDKFSDESLIRALFRKNRMEDKIQHVNRGADIRTDWIDRSWWAVDKDKLFAGGYTECNMLRPLRSNFNKMKEVVEYIYGSPKELGEIL